jgi:hypothetical protein
MDLLSLAVQMHNQQRADENARQAALLADRRASDKEEHDRRVEQKNTDTERRQADVATFNAQLAAQNSKNDYMKDSTAGINTYVVNTPYVQHFLAEGVGAGMTPTQNNALLRVADELSTKHGMTPGAALETARWLAKTGIPLDKAMSRWSGGVMGMGEGTTNANMFDGISTHLGLSTQDVHNRDVVSAASSVMPNTSEDVVYANLMKAVNNGDAAAVDAKDKAEKAAALSALAGLEKQYSHAYDIVNGKYAMTDADRMGLAMQIDGIKKSLNSGETDQNKYQIAQTLNPEDVLRAREFQRGGGSASAEDAFMKEYREQVAAQQAAERGVPTTAYYDDGNTLAGQVSQTPPAYGIRPNGFGVRLVGK